MLRSVILPWPFNGAILIQENEGIYDEFGLRGKNEYFIINKWCYLGTVTTDSEGSINDQQLDKVNFDLDILLQLESYIIYSNYDWNCYK